MTTAAVADALKGFSALALAPRYRFSTGRAAPLSAHGLRTGSWDSRVTALTVRAKARKEPSWRLVAALIVPPQAVLSPES
jgi:hypothetical protein